MAEDVFTSSSPEAIEGLIEAWSSFTPASRALDGLTPEQAVTKLEGWPHSVAEIVAHMVFWQQNNLTTIATGTEPEALDEDSWPTVSEADWPRLKDEFLAGLEKTRELTRDPKNLDRLILDGKFTVGLKIVGFTGHNAYHLGQVVLLRRIIGAWPPPDGGM